MNKEPKLFKISYKITLLVILMVVVCSVFVGVFIFRRVESDIFSTKGMAAQMMAASLASALDPREIQIILETEQENDYYEFIKSAIIETGERMPFIAYTYVMSMREPDFFIIYGQDPQGLIALELGYLYPMEFWNDASIHAHRTGGHIYSAPYSVPDYGDLVSGYAPVIDDEGHVIAIVGFDLSLNEIIAELSALRNSIVKVIVFFVFIFVVITVLLTRKYIGKPLNILNAASKKIALGDMDIHIPDMVLNDEISLLARNFKRAQSVLIGLNEEIDLLVVSAAKGDLSKKIDAQKFEGGWRGLANELNNLLMVMEERNASLTEANETAETATRAKSDFLAAMSHEIRTPMNAIIGITQIQLQDEYLPDEYAQALHKIYNSGSSLLGIINDVLDLSKIETGKLELNPIHYDVPSLIHDAVQINIVRIGSKQIKFQLNVNADLPAMLIGDEIRLRQILNNLLSNAIKYTEEGYVSLHVSTVERYGDTILRFVVADSGQGIANGDKEKLFSDYSRFNTDTNRGIEGTGLGLNITRQLVEMMGGTIRVESEYGEGSIFIAEVKQGAVECEKIGIEFAKKLNDFSYTRENQISKHNITRTPMPYGRVLVVDDVDTNLYVAEGLLAPYKLSVDTVTSGFAAIEKIEQGHVYDIIFMDHMMPKMDGIEATKKLRAMGYHGIIIALTANAIAGNDEMFKQNGFDGFISKPIDIRQLNTALNMYVKNEHPEEAMRLKSKTAKHKADKQINPELLTIFRRDAQKAVIALTETLENGDMKLFATTAHAIKSALANVNEHDASKNAFSLEQAALSGDKEFISANTAELINTLETLIQNIPAPESENPENITEDTAFLTAQLKLIESACNDYDDTTAYAALDSLKQKQWKTKTVDKLNEIRDTLFLNSDFETAALECRTFFGDKKA